MLEGEGDQPARQGLRAFERPPLCSIRVLGLLIGLGRVETLRRKLFSASMWSFEALQTGGGSVFLFVMGRRWPISTSLSSSQA